MAVTITSSNQATEVAKLAAISDAILIQLSAANELIQGEIELALPALYSPRLARYWDIETKVGPVITSVRVRTDSPYVYGYEFGTKPHTIRPQNKSVLAFDVHGERVFAPLVHHPGTPGHFRGGDVQFALNEAAQTLWSEAIDSALNIG